MRLSNAVRVCTAVTVADIAALLTVSQRQVCLVYLSISWLRVVSCGASLGGAVRFDTHLLTIGFEWGRASFALTDTISHLPHDALMQSKLITKLMYCVPAKTKRAELDAIVLLLTCISGLVRRTQTFSGVTNGRHARARYRGL